MKNISIILGVTGLLGLSFISCDREYDTPPIATIPEGNIISIQDAKDMVTLTTPSVSFTEDYSIYGVLTTDETSGNFYKEAYFQDATGGINLRFTSSASTHIGDSIGKDISLNKSVDEKIHPVFGAKSKILKHTSDENLGNFMKNTCYSMIRKGITTFVDFREGGLDGVSLLKKVTKEMSIRSIILGRMQFYQNGKEIKKNISFPSTTIPEFLNLLKK